jgi:hypothetical protein
MSSDWTLVPLDDPEGVAFLVAGENCILAHLAGGGDFLEGLLGIATRDGGGKQVVLVRQGGAGGRQQARTNGKTNRPKHGRRLPGRKFSPSHSATITIAGAHAVNVKATRSRRQPAGVYGV